MSPTLAQHRLMLGFAIIACAGCEYATGDINPPSRCRDNLTGETFTAVRQEGSTGTLILTDSNGRRRLYQGTINLTCDASRVVRQ